MDISAVILTWNSDHFIEKCVGSFISDCGAEYSYEIFVVDNGSSDNTRRRLSLLKQRYGEKIRTIFLSKNHGTTYPRNLALKMSTGDVIVIMDSDVELRKGTISRLISVLNDDKKAGIVAPKLLYPNGHFQKSTDVFPTIFTKIFRYLFLRAIEKRDETLLTSNVPQQVDYAISAMWVMRREMLYKVGFFDENIFYAPEDVDYCLRVWKAGYRIVYVPQAICVHFTQEISRGLKINKATLHHIKGLIYYFKKHSYWLTRPAVHNI